MREYRARISRDTPPLTNLAAQCIGTVLVATTDCVLDHSATSEGHGGRSTTLSRSVGGSRG
jgi:hypothetical protein